MNIEAASVDQAKEISNLIRESNKDVAVEFGINFDNNPKHPSFCNQDWVLSDFERGEEYFVYSLKGVALACVAFENPRPGVAYLNRLSVLPRYRGQGVGEALVNYIVNYGKAKNVHRISIGIIAKHTKLKAWYIKLGFVEGAIKVFPHLPFDVQYMSFDISKSTASVSQQDRRD
jgi:GNAT superfamily N-acetyltransferase